MMNIDAIITALEHYKEGQFPHKAITQAIEEQALITPRLLQAIRDATENIQVLIGNDNTYMLHIYAFYLLAQFRETKAYPVIVAFFAIPGDNPQDATGDVVTEDLGRILASTFDGDVRLLEQLIEDKNVNVYVRSAALQALCILWRYERLSRQQIIDYYRFLFSEKLVGEESFIWSVLVSNSLKLSPNELEQDIDKVFDQGLVETFFIGPADVKEALGLSNEEALKNFRSDDRYGLIEDTIFEIEHWACFRLERKRNSNPVQVKSYQAKPKIGRNQPCPCGSGKKYKKCCLRAN